MKALLLAIALASGSAALAAGTDYPPCSRSVTDHCTEGAASAKKSMINHHRTMHHRARHHYPAKPKPAK